MKPEREPRGERGPVKEESGWGAAEESSEVGELQGERKDARDGDRARTKEPRTAGERGLNAARDWVLPSLPFTLRLRETKRKKTNLDAKHKVAQVGSGLGHLSRLPCRADIYSTYISMFHVI